METVPISTADRLQFFKSMDTRSNIEVINRPKIMRLVNIGNTCAIDSVLCALFAHFTELNHNRDYTNVARRKIAEWSENVHDSISELVPLFKSFPSEDDFHVVGEPKDAIEFLIYFLKIFSKDVVSTKVFKTINGGVVTFASIDRYSSPVQYIPANVLANCDRCMVQDFLINRNVVSEGKITTEEIVQSDIVVFAFSRNMYDGSFVTTRVEPSLSLTVPNGDRFFLGSIVAIDNGHYVAYIRDRTTWYLYDDSGPNVRDVGPLTRADTWSPSPLTHGVLYFYFPDYSSADEHVLTVWTDPNRLVIGVFADIITPKLEWLSSIFKTIRVDRNLPVLKTLEKNEGDPYLRVCDIQTFLQLHVKC